MSTPSSIPPRSLGQWIVTVIFSLLSLAFLFRTLQFAWKWMRHVVEGDANFKALTAWGLIYFLICTAIAAVAYFMPRDEDEPAEENKNAEAK